MQTSPFKFLDAYRKEDRAIFFGRDEEVEKLYNLLLANRLVLVYGQSGTGKSSLIACGLANRFEEADWYAIFVRRNANLIQSIREQIEAHAETPLKKGYSLRKGVKSLYLDHFKPIYFIFDQFEELFILGAQQEKEEFIAFVKELLASDLQCKIILSMREEYIAHLYDFEQEIPSLLSDGLRVAPMSRQGLVEVVEGSAKQFNITLAEGRFTVNMLLDKVGGKKARGVQLPYLQVYLDSLYQQAQAKQQASIAENAAENLPPIVIGELAPFFSPAIAENAAENLPPIEFDALLLEEVGDLENVLETFIEEQVEEVGQRMQNAENGWQLLKLFVTDEGTKKVVNQNAAFQLGKVKNIPQTDIELGLVEYEKRRIIRRVEGNIEVAHDILALQIFGRITAEEKNLFRVERILRGRFEEYQLNKRYLNSGELSYLSPYLAQLVLPEEIESFVAKSQLRLRRRRRRIATALVVLFIGLLGFGSYTYWALQQQKQETLIAQQQAEEEKLKRVLDEEVRQKKAQKIYGALNHNSQLFQELREAMQRNDIRTVRRIIRDSLQFEFDNGTFDEIGKLIDGRALVQRDGIYGYVNLNGELVIPLTYEEASAFENGSAEVVHYGIRFRIDTANNCIDNCDSLEVQIDRVRALLAQKYDEVRGLKEGFFAVRKGGQWGFVDSYGNPAIELKYDYVEDFKNARAFVTKDKNVSIINRDGECIDCEEVIAFTPNRTNSQETPEEEIKSINYTWEVDPVIKYRLNHGKPLKGAVMSPNGFLTLTIAVEETQIWDMIDGRRQAYNEKIPSSNVLQPSIFDSTSRKIIFPSFDAWRIYELKGQMRQVKKGGEGNNARFGFFSPDNKYIFFNDSTGRLGVLNAENYQLHAVRAQAHLREIADARFMGSKYLGSISLDGEGLISDRSTLKPLVELSWLALADIQLARKERDPEFVRIMQTIENTPLKIDTLQSNPLFNEMYFYKYEYRESSATTRAFKRYEDQFLIERDLTTIKRRIGNELKKRYQQLYPRLTTQEGLEKRLEEDFKTYKKLKYAIRKSADFELINPDEIESFYEFVAFLHNYNSFESYQKQKEFLKLFRYVRANTPELTANNDFFFQDVAIRMAPDGGSFLTSYGRLTTGGGAAGLAKVRELMRSLMTQELNKEKGKRITDYRFLTPFDIQASLQELFENRKLIPGHELWSINGGLLRHIPIQNTAVALAEYAPNSQYIVGISSANIAALWNMKGQRIAVFEGHQEPISFLAFSQDSELVFTASLDNTIRIWDLSGNLLKAIDAHADDVNHIFMVPSKKRGVDKFITSSNDGTAIVWEMKRKKVPLTQ